MCVFQWLQYNVHVVLVPSEVASFFISSLLLLIPKHYADMQNKADMYFLCQ